MDKDIDISSGGSEESVLTSVISDQDNRCQVQEHCINVLIIGKTGNGKSTVGNSLLNRSGFPVSSGMMPSTTHSQTESAKRHGVNIKVTDTPDVSNMSLYESEPDKEIQNWCTCHPDIILLTIRSDVRYTSEEFQTYQQIKRVLTQQYLCPRLVVAFTFPERLVNDLEEELKTAPTELRQVLNDAKDRYLVFREEDEEEMKKKHLENLRFWVPNLGCGVNVLIVGKTGNGKSTVGNSLLNKPAFSVSSGMASSTVHAETASAPRYGVNITVIDTPDVSNMSLYERDQEKEIRSWSRFHPDIILLTIRSDVRYTSEEFQTYQQIKRVLTQQYLCPRLVVAFTFPERLVNDLEEELKTAPTELRQVLNDAKDRYLVFREEDEEEMKKKHLVHLKFWVPNLDMDVELKKILLLGPPKSGKSSGGDAIIGRSVFKAGTKTDRTISYLTEIDGTWCQVFDTPGISSVLMEEQLSNLLKMTRPGPYGIFFFVRESLATNEDVELFKKFQDYIEERLWQQVKIVAYQDLPVSNKGRTKDILYALHLEKKVPNQDVWLLKDMELNVKNLLFADHIHDFFKTAKNVS